MNYLVLLIGCQDQHIHLKIQANLLFIMFNETLITMYAGCHNVKWVYLNEAKQHYFWNEIMSLLVLLLISYCQICYKPRVHILLSLVVNAVRSDGCCTGTFQCCRKNFFQNLLIFSGRNLSLRNLCRNLKIFLYNAHFSLLCICWSI